MRFVIVTGMSGGGKSTAIRMLEDMGFYCVDNLPVSLIKTFVDLIVQPASEMTKVALGLDVRTDHRFEEALRTIRQLRAHGYPCEILFMDASDDTLVRRYKETRRLHPLSEGDRIEDGIRRERAILKDARGQADYVIDTSRLLTRELNAELTRLFVEGDQPHSMMVTILSFGFKHGIPSDADLVFDVRFLPNPFYVEELKHLTGNDKPVQDYVKQFPECGQFVDKLADLLTFLIPGYINEGKQQLVIAIGCTGGQHRSVTIAHELYRRMGDDDRLSLRLANRDLPQHGKAGK